MSYQSVKTISHNSNEKVLTKPIRHFQTTFLATYFWFFFSCGSNYPISLRFSPMKRIMTSIHHLYTRGQA